MKRFIVLMIILMCLSSQAWAQSATKQGQEGKQAAQSLIQVGEDRPVEINSAGLATTEPSLAANPRDANHLLAGVILVKQLGDPRRPSDPSHHTCAALTSFDAGRTWARHDFPMKECIDPWVAILPDGSAMFVAVSISPRGAELVGFRSADGGRTWSDRAESFGYRHDHPTMAVDNSKGAFAGSLYLVSYQAETWRPIRNSVFVTRAAGGSAPFSEPARIIPSNLSTFAMSPVVLSDGMLVVPFMNFSRARAEGSPASFERAPAWALRSTDGARSFSIPLFITDVCAGGFPNLAADASAGPYRDRLYWVCNDRRRENVYALYSADRGETWSEPVVLNRGAGTIPYAQVPMVAVNRDGVVGVSWYDARNDRREYRGTTRCQDVYFTASPDGGRTFLPEVKVSSAENCADTPQNGEAGRRWVAGGDYHGLAASADGSFHLFWADSRTGIYQLRTANIRIKPTAQ